MINVESVETSKFGNVRIIFTDESADEVLSILLDKKSALDLSNMIKRKIK